MDKRHAETIQRENGNNIWNSFHSNLESSGRKEESIWKEIIKLEAAQLVQHSTWHIIPMQEHGHKVHLILLRSQQDTTRSNRLPFCLPLVFFLSFFPCKSDTFTSFPSNFTESSSFLGPPSIALSFKLQLVLFCIPQVCSFIPFSSFNNTYLNNRPQIVLLFSDLESNGRNFVVYFEGTLYPWISLLENLRELTPTI